MLNKKKLEGKYPRGVIKVYLPHWFEWLFSQKTSLIQ